MTEEQFHILERWIHAMVKAITCPSYEAELYLAEVRHEGRHLLID